MRLQIFVCNRILFCVFAIFVCYLYNVHPFGWFPRRLGEEQNDAEKRQKNLKFHKRKVRRKKLEQYRIFKRIYYKFFKTKRYKHHLIYNNSTKQIVGDKQNNM